MVLNKKIVTVIIALPLSFIITAAVWALDQRYMTYAAFEEIAQSQRINNLSDRIDELTLKESLGLASEYEKAVLKQLKEKIKVELGVDSDG